MNRKFGPIVFLVVVVLILVHSAFFIVDETQQAIVVQLGKPVTGVKAPGIHFKIPFIQEVIYFERRLLDYDASPAEILTSDKKNLKVDNYAKWKVVDPLKFYRTVQSVSGAQARLDDIIYAELRVELGRHLMIDIISKVRSQIMANVTERADAKARDYGISVVDVRIKRADLPKENERAVFGRMRTERERQAKKYRSEGQEEALKLRATADREKTIILAEAFRKSQEFRGQGDAESIRIYADAFGQDPEFFHFLRSLEAYRKALSHETTMVMSQEDDFLRFLRSENSLSSAGEEPQEETAAAEPSPAAPPAPDTGTAPEESALTTN